MNARNGYLLGLFLICAGVLITQIATTRLLSILFFYHLAFVSISMAMLGLTGGAVGVWWLERKYGKLNLGVWLPRMCVAFTGLLVFSIAIVTSVLVKSPVALVLLLAGMLPPYLAAGVAVSLALTRSPYPMGVTYGSDLLGAALGCLLALGLLYILPPISALLVVAGFGLLAALGFAKGLSVPAPKVALWGGFLLLAALIQIQAPMFQQVSQKSKNGIIDNEMVGSNPYSYITITQKYKEPYFYWGSAVDAPQNIHTQALLQIDGLAGTPLYEYKPTPGNYDFLRYDVTNIAYTIRHKGKSAVIGIGGGRDLISARHFGFEDVTGVELNPIFVNLLTKIQPYADFAHIGLDPKVKLVVDDGRSWFARTEEKFDLLQMSMVDTWAATGAGNFTLSENGLYTLEGWMHFVKALKPNGVFTVSRWYAPNDVNESGRMIALAMAVLHKLGVPEPRKHIYVAGTEKLATLVLSPDILSKADVLLLDKEVAARGYRVLVHPVKRAASDLLEGIVGAPDYKSLVKFTSSLPLDLTPTTDSRPFFFNQLKLSNLFFEIGHDQTKVGVLSGNLQATAALLVIVFISLVFVCVLLLVPALGALEGVSPKLGKAGSLYFMLIGLGFMFVEMGLIERMSLFLGHPVYSLAIVLFSLILATGIGSFVSDRVKKVTPKFTQMWVLAMAGLIAVVALFGSCLTSRFESAHLLARALITILSVAPPAVLMGFAFPIGLRLTEKIDPRPAPWFWGVNGAAGVLASGLAVLCSMTFSITVTLLVGAVFYLLLLVPLKSLQKA